MIDITEEQVIPFTAAPKQVPTRGNGKHVNVSTIFRWAQKGVRGIRLEFVQVGGTMCTSVEALQRFCDALTAQKAAANDSAPREPTPRQRSAAAEKAKRELAQAGI